MSSPSDLSVLSVLEFLKTMSKPINLLKLVNLAPGSNWSFRVGVGREQMPLIEVEYPAAVSESTLIGSVVPEVWFGTPEVDADRRLLTITEFGGNNVHPAWSDAQLVEDLLRDNTWFGGLCFADSTASVKIQVLGHSSTFKPANCTYFERADRSVSLDAGPLSLRYVSFPGSRHFEVRDAVYGAQVPGVLKELAESIRSMGVKSGGVEFGLGWLKPGPMGLVQLTHEAQQVLGDQHVTESWRSKLQSVARQMREGELKVAAARLNRRKQEVRSADRVYSNDRLIGTVPTSEAGTVALVHKLEALTAFPVSEFTTYGWAGPDGVDALGDFQLDALHAVQQNVAIEYEFHFSSFLKHNHPHEHVGLVVCWDLDSKSLQNSDHPWLNYIDDGSHRIPVLSISDFPNIQIKKVSEQ